MLFQVTHLFLLDHFFYLFVQNALLFFDALLLLLLRLLDQASARSRQTCGGPGEGRLLAGALASLSLEGLQLDDTGQ